jgi:hypothetical protein
MSWYHGTGHETADEALGAGRVGPDYRNRKAVWGAGVYLSDDAREVARFGERTLEMDASEAKLWDVSGESWGWGPVTVADQLPDERREAFRDSTAYSPEKGFGDYGASLRDAIMQMGYDGLVFRGDHDNQWAVVYRPELVRVSRELDPAQVEQLPQVAPVSFER